MEKIELVMNQTGDIAESKNYLETKADSVVTVGTNVDGDELLTLVFLNNYPIVQNQSGNVTVTGIEKRRVASVTLGMGQARKFYDSLKSIFEPE